MTLAQAQGIAAPNPQTGEEVVFPPGDLYSVEPFLETHLHLQQLLLLLKCLNWFWPDRDNYLATGNLTILYQDPSQCSAHSHRLGGW